MTRAGLVQAAKSAGASASSQPGKDATRGWTRVLAEIPLFAHIPDRHLRKIAALGSVVRFDAGSQVLQTGQAGDAFYVVLDGKGSVIRRRGLASIPIKTGAYFGEMALIDGRPRTATIVADTELTCLRLGRSAFQKVLRNESSVSLALLNALAGRIRDLENATTA